jgi:hypothetical protein
MSIVSMGTQYSTNDFIQAASKNAVKKGNAVTITTDTGKQLTLPFRDVISLVRNDLYSDYVDTMLFKPMHQNECVTFLAPRPIHPLMAFHVEKIIVDLNKVKSVKDWGESFALLRNKIMRTVLQQLTPLVMLEIIETYLPTQDVPDGCTLQECLKESGFTEKEGYLSTTFLL